VVSSWQVPGDSLQDMCMQAWRCSRHGKQWRLKRSLGTGEYGDKRPTQVISSVSRYEVPSDSLQDMYM
jgi:hypothetical protein